MNILRLNPLFRMTKEQKIHAYKIFQTELTEPKTFQYARSEEDFDEPHIDTCKNLSIKPEKSQIIHIPFQIVTSIFEKASELLEDHTNISRFPGNYEQSQKMKFLISSKSNPLQPHTVPVNNSGQVTCDNECASWKVYKICSHCVAVSEHHNKLKTFILWFNKIKKNVSITELALFNMP